MTSSHHPRFEFESSRDKKYNADSLVMTNTGLWGRKVEVVLRISYAKVGAADGGLGMVCYRTTASDIRVAEAYDVEDARD